MQQQLYDVFLGIDPGRYGALAVYEAKENIMQVYDFTDFGAMADILRECKKKYGSHLLGVIEQVHAMPKQGVVSTFNFGVNYGGWQGLLAMGGIVFRGVSPQKWQKEMTKKVNGKTTKDRSRAMAASLFPEQKDLFKRKKDADRADAVNIAVYGSKVYGYTPVF